MPRGRTRFTPPHLTDVNNSKSHSFRTHIHALLHAVRTRCGRVSSLAEDDRRAKAIAARYGLSAEYRAARRNGLTPIEALEDWDMLKPEERALFTKK